MEQNQLHLEEENKMLNANQSQSGPIQPSQVHPIDRTAIPGPKKKQLNTIFRQPGREGVFKQEDFFEQVQALLRAYKKRDDEAGRAELAAVREEILKNLKKRVFGLKQTLEGHKREVSICTQSRDSLLVATSSRDLTIRLWARESSETAPDQLYTLQQTLTGLEKVPDALIFRQDSLMLAMGSDDWKIRIWAREHQKGEFRPFQIIEGHQETVSCLDMTPNGDQLVSGGHDETIRLWKLSDDKKRYNAVQVISQNCTCTNTVKFLFDGEWVASGADDNNIMIWGRKEPGEGDLECVQVLGDHTDNVNTIVLSEDWRTLVSASEDKTIKVFSIAPPRSRRDKNRRYELFQSIAETKDCITQLQMDKTGCFLVSGSEDNIVRVWCRLATDRRFKLSQVLDQFVEFNLWSVSLSEDCCTLVCGFHDKKARVWTRPKDTHRFEPLKHLEIPEEDEDMANDVSMGLLPSGEAVVVAAMNNDRVLMWREGDKTDDERGNQGKNEGDEGSFGFEKKYDLKDFATIVEAVGLSSDARTMVTGSDATSIWRMGSISAPGSSEGGGSLSYDKAQTLKTASIGVLSLAVSDNTEVIAVGYYNRTIGIKRRAPNGDKNQFEETQIIKETNLPNSVALSKTGDILVIGTDDKMVKVFKSSKNPKKSPKSHPEFVLTQTLKGHPGCVNSVTISHNNTNTIISGGDEGSLIVWTKSEDSKEYKLSQHLYGHTGEIHAVGLTRDSETLFSGCHNDTVRVWRKQRNKGYTFSYLLEIGDSVHSMAFRKGILAIGVLGSQDLVKIAKIQSDPKDFFSAFGRSYVYTSCLYSALSMHKNLTEGLGYLLKTLPDVKPKIRNSVENATKFVGFELNNVAQRADGAYLLKIHVSANPVYWFAAFDQPEMLKIALDKWGYEDWVYLDYSKGEDLPQNLLENRQKQLKYDPFLVSLEHDNQEILDVWVDYFTRHSHRLHIYTPERLNRLISSSSTKLQKIALNHFLGTSEPHLTSLITLYSINEYDRFQSVESNSELLDQKAVSRLRHLEDKSRPSESVECRSTTIPIPNTLSGNLMLLEAARESTAETKLQLRPLIISLFNKNWLVFYLYSLAHVMATVIFFVTVSFQYYSIFTLVPFFAIYCFMAVFELIDIVRNASAYFGRVYNLLDVLLYPLAMALTAYLVIDGYKVLDHQLENGLITLLLYVALTRSVSMLRVLNQTRYLMLMILRVYIDMLPFLTVLLAYILGTGCMYMVVAITNGESVFTLKEFQLKSDLIYNWGYGNWEGTSEMNTITFLFYLHTGVFVGLVMFNLLIAIISGTYEQFTEERELVDVKELLDMLCSMAACSRVFGRFLLLDRVGGRARTTYYHFLVPEDQSQGIAQVLERVGELEGSMRALVNQSESRVMAGVERRVREGRDEVLGKVEALRAELGGKLDQLIAVKKR